MTLETSDAKRRAAAAVRMRRSRQRRRDGLRMVHVEIWDREIDGLIRRGLLTPDARTDKLAVLRALHSFFDRTLGRTP